METWEPVTMSRRTPFGVFSEASGSAAMASLPWAMVPTMLVPLVC
jgi:hypothetical protein